MKRIYLFFILVLMVSLQGFSQNEKKDEHHPLDVDKFNAQKMAYLIQEVGITPEEAAKLFPLYNEMQEKRFKMMKETIDKVRALRKNQNPKDEECLSLLDELLNKQVCEANMEKSYYQKFKKILSPQKVLKLKQADFRFARDVLRKNDQRKPDGKK
ncbi:MAG: hypothetical protein Q8909_05390 [Bacteroidota bacterium]|uniref:hypothetical protein n=1 Tax=Parabacteroides sp. FAFU027 TaxID=2922715 RepID=UPI001FAEE042|nr:hypothetical protein [Parabacteroides sp. FAFU027]MDP4269541.1 hypothetical protein [Bacteroidota bacterium]